VLSLPLWQKAPFGESSSIAFKAVVKCFLGTPRTSKKCTLKLWVDLQVFIKDYLKMTKKKIHLVPKPSFLLYLTCA
jgi:hypothetical protein